MATTIGIERTSVNPDHFNETWGIDAYDYQYNGTVCDLQDMMVCVTQQRALAIEDEVSPLETIVNRRNERIEKYGYVLSALTELQAKFAQSESGSDQQSISVSLSSSTITRDEFNSIMTELGYSNRQIAEGSSSLTMSKAECEGAVSAAKSQIDEMNNSAQKDMTRLQSIVDRRDESFSTATTLMQAISDTRTAVIKAM